MLLTPYYCHPSIPLEHRTCMDCGAPFLECSICNYNRRCPVCRQEKEIKFLQSLAKADYAHEWRISQKNRSKHLQAQARYRNNVKVRKRLLDQLHEGLVI